MRSELSMTARKRAAAFLLVFTIGLAACHRTQAVHTVPPDQTPQAATCNLTDEETGGLNLDLSTNVYAMRAYTATVSHLLKEENFEALDCVAAHARSDKERFSGGAWKLHELYHGLSEPEQYPMHVTDENWDSRLQQLQSWATARPQSVTARVALASAYIAYAADVRGDGPPDTVSESGWKLFRERTAQAKRLLKEASALPTRCPEWYVVMLQVAQNQNWKASKQRALLKKATRLEPEYYDFARVFARGLLPQWGGKPGASEKFTQKIADRVGGAKGDILYFQIATAVPTCACGGDSHLPHLSLKRIERGFDASEKQFGVSMVSLNRMAFWAIRARPDDQVLAYKAFTRIGEQWDQETWKRRADFDLGKDAANFMGPRLMIEEEADANMKTPEGIQYRASIDKPYQELLRQCVWPGDHEGGTFKALTKVGEHGTVEDVSIRSNNPTSMCAYEKLITLQREKATPFPPPPHAPYWVRFDLNLVDVTPVAAK